MSQQSLEPLLRARAEELGAQTRFTTFNDTLRGFFRLERTGAAGFLCVKCVPGR